MQEIQAGLIPGSGRSPGGGNGNPLQYSCLENSMDRGTWWATVESNTTEHTHMHASAEDTGSVPGLGRSYMPWGT